MDKKVIILSFSPRNNGNCSNIADFIVQYYGKVNTTRFDITAENISPCYNCNYECLRSQSLCPRLTDYQMQVMDASVNGSVIYFIVPNFCGQPNANYYAFNERSVGYFNLNQQLLEKYLSVDFLTADNKVKSNYMFTVTNEGFSVFRLLRDKVENMPKLYTLNLYNNQLKLMVYDEGSPRENGRETVLTLCENGDVTIVSSMAKTKKLNNNYIFESEKIAN